MLYIYISIRYEILGRETNLSSPLFIKVPVPSQGREWHVFAMGIDFTSVSMFIRLNVGVVPTVLFFLSFLSHNVDIIPVLKIITTCYWLKY